MRKSLVALALSAFVLLAAPVAAHADTTYPPPPPTEPTLSGTVATGVCDSDSPYIRYSIVLNDPSGVEVAPAATLILSGSGESVSIPLGALQNGRLSGSVLWPGASVDADGVANGWPGWTLQNGQYVQTDGNYAWTRGNITAVIEVNPSIAVPLSYPAQTPTCAVDPPMTGAAASLPATGLGAAVLPIGIAGGIIALVGAGLLVARRVARR